MWQVTYVKAVFLRTSLKRRTTRKQLDESKLSLYHILPVYFKNRIPCSIKDRCRRGFSCVVLVHAPRYSFAIHMVSRRACSPMYKARTIDICSHHRTQSLYFSRDPSERPSNRDKSAFIAVSYASKTPSSFKLPRACSFKPPGVCS
jgi:hypothetical protein